MKNRNRNPFSFANINLLGKCNVDCFFCLGKDLEDDFGRYGNNLLKQEPEDWRQFPEFIETCKEHEIKKVYITGQNTDAFCYPHLGHLLGVLNAEHWFDTVGVRTNGFFSTDPVTFHLINDFDSVGYSIHTLNPLIQRAILGKSKVPDWPWILNNTRTHCRVSIVVNRFNWKEVDDLLQFLSGFECVDYIQLRKVCTDTRAGLLREDMDAFETVTAGIMENISGNMESYESAPSVEIYGKDVTFWRTVETTANSINYFIDGTLSEEYFVIEGYAKKHGLEL